MHKVVGIAIAGALLLLLLASTALVATRSSAALPHWLAHLRSNTRHASVTPATPNALLQRRRMRAPRATTATTATVTTTGSSTKRAAANSHTQLRDRIWQLIVTLMDAVATRIRSSSTSSSAVESRVPHPYAYGLWLDDDTTDTDNASIDSDACTTIYRDSTQRQVCATSI